MQDFCTCVGEFPSSQRIPLSVEESIGQPVAVFVGTGGSVGQPHGAQGNLVSNRASQCSKV